MRRQLIIGVALGILLLGGVAYASIPSPDGVIHACYKTSNPGQGGLIVIDTDAGQSCPNGFTVLDWNQTGPQGPAGPEGAAGPQGPSGVVNTYAVASQWYVNWGPFETDCNTGDRALSAVVEYVPGQSVEPVSLTPVLNAGGHPKGYSYFNTILINGGAQWRVHVTCAPATS